MPESLQELQGDTQVAQSNDPVTEYSPDGHDVTQVDPDKYAKLDVVSQEVQLLRSLRHVSHGEFHIFV